MRDPGSSWAAVQLPRSRKRPDKNQRNKKYLFTIIHPLHSLPHCLKAANFLRPRLVRKQACPAEIPLRFPAWRAIMPASLRGLWQKSLRSSGVSTLESDDLTSPANSPSHRPREPNINWWTPRTRRTGGWNTLQMRETVLHSAGRERYFEPTWGEECRSLSIDGPNWPLRDTGGREFPIVGPLVPIKLFLQEIAGETLRPDKTYLPASFEEALQPCLADATGPVALVLTFAEPCDQKEYRRLYSVAAGFLPTQSKALLPPVDIGQRHGVHSG